MYTYQAFQLPILSDLFLPELTNGGSSTGLTDTNLVRIQLGAVNPDGLGFKDPHFQSIPMRTWLHIPDVARFLIENGNTIIVEPLNNVNSATLRLFLLGSCMGILLMQRDLLLLHGNAICVGDRCISIVADSGLGKSTLSGAFMKRGYSILADDICAINRQNHVLPSFPQIKLCTDAVAELGMSTDALEPIMPRLEKFAVPLGNQYHSYPLSLALVYVLNVHEKKDVTLESVSGPQKIQPLHYHVYRKEFLKALQKEHFYFTRCAQIASEIAVVHITRPIAGFQLDALVSAIENDLKARGLLATAH